MQITGLKIVGFKSFVDPVEVAIEHGLSGVVGPNGCGKSNLLEAMRWVMGASSARAMRGGEMDDLIFSGSAQRPAREHCEVTLLLDNAARTAPAEFNAEDVLEIRRRLRRGAGSSYKINGRTVRAKDVQLLFADASTGANSPALVRQGQISELIGAKPQNRRRVLEEAAGIGGLTARRHESELKLDAASANLDKLDEVIGEVERRIATLKRQAGKANRYRSLREALETQETALAVWRWQEARRERDGAEAALRTARGELDAAVSALALAATAETRARTRIPPLRDAETEAAGRLGAVKFELSRLESEARSAEETMLRLEKDLARIVEDQSREHGLREEALAAMTRSAEQLADAPDTDAAADREALAALTRDHEAAKRALAEAEDAADAIARTQTQAESAARSAQTAMAREEQRLSAADAAMARLRTECDALGDRSALAEALEDAREALAEAEAEAERAALEAETAAEAAAAAADAEKEAAGPAEAVRAEIRTLEAEIAGLERLSADSAAGKAPPVLDAVRPDAGFERALAAALGDDLTATLDPDDALYWSGRTGDERPRLPEGTTPLSEHVDAPKALTARLSLCGLADRADGPRLQPLLRPGQRLVSREGDLWRWDGYVRTAQAPSASAEKLEHRARLDARRKSLEAARKTSEKLECVLEAAQAAADAARQAEQAARARGPELARTASQAREAVLRAAQDVERLDLRAASNTESLNRIAADRDLILQALAEARTSAASGPSDDDREQLARARDALRQAREAERAAYNAAADLEREQERRKGRRAALEREHGDWERRARVAEHRLDDLAAQRTAIRGQLDAARETPHRLAARKEELSAEAAQAESERQNAADALAVAETGLREAEATARAARETESASREQIGRCEARLESAARRQDEAAILAAARLDDAAEALPLRQDLDGLVGDGFDPGDSDAEIARLRRDLDALGPVNLEADDELGESAERLELKLSERQDLAAAIAKLREGVATLNAEGRARLLEAFHSVAAHFKSLFETLFEGGEAELRLTESDDPLNAGLEIFACPPGKRLSALSLMSGGEQALTATALIFAVFLSRPAPICVLDEVDAPLDDANVDRYCRMLDSMRQRTDTRFLVITHNAVTMSRMDRLFGVTMQESGVSRLVSVDLQVAEQLAAAQ